jgi:hypothetical protein
MLDLREMMPDADVTIDEGTYTEPDVSGGVDEGGTSGDDSGE